MEVILYSTGCPQCKILEQLLNKKKIIFKIEDDVEKMKRLGFTTLPMLKVEENIFNFKEAFQWVGGK